MNLVLCGGKGTRKHLTESVETLDSPRVLIVPSARITESGHQNKVSEYLEFFRQLGAKVEVLNQFNQTPTQTELQHKFGQANFIHALGGDTISLLDRWKTSDLPSVLKEFLEDPRKIYTASSAGSLAVFQLAHIGPSRFTQPERIGFTVMEGVNLVGCFATVHASATAHNTNKPRLEYFRQDIPTTDLTGVAIDDYTALIVRDDKIKAAYTDGQQERIQIFASGGDVYNPETLDTEWSSAETFGITIKSL